MSYRPIEIVDTWEDWEIQTNPPLRRGKRRDARWSNFNGLEIKIALIRAPNYDPHNKQQILGSGDVFKFMQPTLQDEVVESFFVLLMNAKHYVIGVHKAARGTITRVEIVPADIIRVVLAAGVCAFIVVHNHPSGDTEPSIDDISVTNRIKSAADMLGLRMLDHIIISFDKYVSMTDRGQL